MAVGQPLANYAAYKRSGNWVFMSGVIAVNPTTRSVINSYEQLSPHAQAELQSVGLMTGQMSVDVFEAPMAAQAWFVLNRIRELAAESGSDLSHVVRLVQYFRDIRQYPVYNRVRGLFFKSAVVSTVVEVSRMLPSDVVTLEVEATLHIIDV